MINNYEDFIAELLKAGFSMGGGNSDGIYAVIPWSWNEVPPCETPVRWHTGDPETDPWAWRMRVLDERDDIAYAKLFFKKSGYISREWYPYFLAARRQNLSLEQAYRSGTISMHAKRIYETIAQNGALPLHAIKVLGGFRKEDKSAFDRALTELQMKLYITMCGQQQKLSRIGEEYGWSSTVFCLAETYFGQEVLDEAAAIAPGDAADRISAQILQLNPQATDKRIQKFIFG